MFINTCLLMRVAFVRDVHWIGIVRGVVSACLMLRTANVAFSQCNCLQLVTFWCVLLWLHTPNLQRSKLWMLYIASHAVQHAVHACMLCTLLLLPGNLDAKEVVKAKEGQQADFPDGIEECGTDALRFALVAYTTQARDINLDIKRVVAYRHWCNKLWNAIKFAIMNLPEGFQPAVQLDVGSYPAASRWLLSRLNNAISTVVKVRFTDWDVVMMQLL